LAVEDEQERSKSNQLQGKNNQMGKDTALTRPVMTEVLFDEMYSVPSKGNVRLEHLPESKALHLQWYGMLSHEDHTTFANKTINFIKQLHTRRWIGDVSHIIEPLPVDIAYYIADTWFPEAVKAGIEKLAIVMPAVEKVKPSTNKIAEALLQKNGDLLKTFPLKAFISREEARQWICS
jgi:hypothetical protein